MFEAKDFESKRATQFQALADPIRLQIIAVLNRGPRCVCEIQSAVGPIAANLLSYHLGILRGAGLISAQRRGRWMDYRLEYTEFAALRASLPEFLADPREEPETVEPPAREHAEAGRCTGPQGAGRQGRGKGEGLLRSDPFG